MKREFDQNLSRGLSVANAMRSQVQSDGCTLSDQIEFRIGISHGQTGITTTVDKGTFESYEI
jgi:hypothetical protein